MSGRKSFGSPNGPRKGSGHTEQTEMRPCAGGVVGAAHPISEGSTRAYIAGFLVHLIPIKAWLVDSPPFRSRRNFLSSSSRLLLHPCLVVCGRYPSVKLNGYVSSCTSL